MKRIYVQSTGLESWRQLLADPVNHWKAGFSAMSTAQSWETANGFPPKILRALGEACEPLRSLVPLLIIPEHHVPLPGGSKESQSDVWVLAAHTLGLASIAVEGKVNESFGPSVSEWLRGASSGKTERLAFLTELLGLTQPIPGSSPYQLLHRMASAILEAKRFHANVAVCVVQSFSPTDTGFSEFASFCNLFGKQPQIDEPTQLGLHGGLPFYAVWIRDA